MKKLILLAIAMACVDVTWAQTAPRAHISTIEDLLRSPEVSWSYRTEIIEGLSREDIIPNFEHDLQWARDMYLSNRQPPQNLREAKAQERDKAENKDIIAATLNLVARADRATVLLHKIRGYDFRDPLEFHKTLIELITIGRTHVIFSYEQILMWHMRHLFPSCEIPMVSGV